MKKIMVFAVSALLLIAGRAFDEGRMIRGTVTSDEGLPLKDVTVSLKGTSLTTLTDRQGKYTLEVPFSGGTIQFAKASFNLVAMAIGNSDLIDVILYRVQVPVPLEDKEIAVRPEMGTRQDKKYRASEKIGAVAEMTYQPWDGYTQPQWNTEEYDGINENIFHGALQNPLSTFSIDVDAASYSNIRRFIHNGQRPPKDAVRIEEMINYFTYDYKQPKGKDPFSIYTEISTAPWNSNHKLVHIGLQGKIIPTENLPPSNLVFLIDVSGSMEDVNKLPLLKSSFKLLVGQLREQDRVAIVVYAGAAGLVLPSTSGAQKQKIIDALDQLQAGGSTAGGAGIQLAYQVAVENFQKEGNNRVIIATDGDFNVGESSNAAMERLIEEKRKAGVFLTVLGFGMGNYKDSKMEILADKGNGNYAYIDNILEAQKVLVNEFGGTLFTIAKDVKLQVEFNSAKVQAYRLIGYENRILKNEDFNNDKKDAGELGSGHTVTALYEIIPVGVQSEFFKTDPLKYQNTQINPFANATKEWMTVKFRYKHPSQEVSQLIVHSLSDREVSLEQASENFRWSAAVAGFGMILRESEYVGGFTTDQVLTLAEAARGEDKQGYRLEFINMVKSDLALARR